jgi:hypothetical protein
MSVGGMITLVSKVLDTLSNACVLLLLVPLFTGGHFVIIGHALTIGVWYAAERYVAPPPTLYHYMNHHVVTAILMLAYPVMLAAIALGALTGWSDVARLLVSLCGAAHLAAFKISTYDQGTSDPSVVVAHAIAQILVGISDSALVCAMAATVLTCRKEVYANDYKTQWLDAVAAYLVLSGPTVNPVCIEALFWSLVLNGVGGDRPSLGVQGIGGTAKLPLFTLEATDAETIFQPIAVAVDAPPSKTRRRARPTVQMDDC